MDNLFAPFLDLRQATLLAYHLRPAFWETLQGMELRSIHACSDCQVGYKAER